MADIDWGAWSRQAVASLKEKNEQWHARFGIPTGTPYQWHLDCGEIMFDRGHDLLVADLCIVGSTSSSEGTFQWSWANARTPSAALRDIGRVRAFGKEHGLELLVDAEWPGGKPEGLEMLALAARILDGEGGWVAPSGDLILYFVLRNFRSEERPADLVS
jgi:hypothetical protein